MATNLDSEPIYERPSFDLWLMELAHHVARRGSCRRKQVGAIIARDRDHHVVSMGYNGAPRGMPDCFEVGCEMREFAGKPSCVRTVHAESNALDGAYADLASEPHTLYCTVTPCRDCALRIIQRGITRVVYAEYYESRSTKDVVALFTRTDPDTTAKYVKRMQKGSGEGWFSDMAEAEKYWMLHATPRVGLYQIDMLTGVLKAVRP